MAEAIPRFVILGGGVSGLTTAFFLQRAFPLARISVVEPTKRCGGQILSVRGQDGHLFEQGFHGSMLNHRMGRETLGLVKLLNLDKEVTTANIEKSARRHLYHNGRVQLFPRVPHMLRHLPAMMAEPLWRRSSAADESVHEFTARRISTAVADQIADPICRGMFAGDARDLSVRTCFPRLWFNEKRYRSIFVGSGLGTFAAYKRRSWLSLDLTDSLLQRVSTGGRCFSFKDGLSTLVDGLLNKLQNPSAGIRPVEIITETAANKMEETTSSGMPAATVHLSDGQEIIADCVIATVPPRDLAHLLEESGLNRTIKGASDTSLCQLLSETLHESAAVVGASFDTDVLKGRFSGAGYFCGSREQQGILGMSWDSQLFPEQSSSPGGARLTVYVDGKTVSDTTSAEDVAMAAVRNHLGVNDSPTEVRATIWKDATPRYAVGHHERMQTFNNSRVRHLPWLQVAGAGYFGPRAPADEVVDARALTDALGRRFARFPGLVENETHEDVADRYGGGFDAQ